MPPYDYSAIDAEIDHAIGKGCNTLAKILAAPGVKPLVQRAARLTGRDDFRVVDGRLQALRKRGLISHDILGIGWTRKEQK